MDIGQPSIDPIVPETQFFEVDPQQPQNRRVQVVAVDRILLSFPSPVVSGAVGDAPFDSAAG